MMDYVSENSLGYGIADQSFTAAGTTADKSKRSVA